MSEPTTKSQMADDVIIGFDGKPRCAWAGAGDTALGRYHDDVWGTRAYDQSALFEALTLGVFQAGLSWAIVFGKRDALRRVFHGFDVARVAAMTQHDVDRLVQDPSIIRNRAKILAAVKNARAMSSASPRFRRRSHDTEAGAPGAGQLEGPAGTVTVRPWWSRSGTMVP
jgi:DNA-3-methyladenine glycosylase I